MVMAASAATTPLNTHRREWRMDKMTAIKKLLSPSSETVMSNNPAVKAVSIGSNICMKIILTKMHENEGKLLTLEFADRPLDSQTAVFRVSLFLSSSDRAEVARLFDLILNKNIEFSKKIIIESFLIHY
jgi:hypothetical protein